MVFTRRRFVTVVLAIAASGVLAASEGLAPFRIDPDRYLAHVKFLASDDLGGRGNGTPGLTEAADYIAAEWKAAGLQGGASDGGFFAAFQVDGRRIGPDRSALYRVTVRNVIGVLPGHDPARAGEAVVVGAHYDHLGSGVRFSAAPEARGQIHNGADDNASGTAALLEMARVAAASRARFPRTVIFVAFAAEEAGLLGSLEYVADPPVPLSRTVAMINLDMVGRPGGRVLVGSLVPPAGWPAPLDALAPHSTLRIEPFGQGRGYSRGSSDDTSFADAGVPTVTFFTGFHDDYHRPSDDWERIDPAGGAEVATLALALAQALASR